MLSKIKSMSLEGLTGYLVEIQSDVSGGLPNLEIVGLPDVRVKEAKERVKTAIKNSGIEFPSRKIIVNLAPADIRKWGTSYDLPIAISVLGALKEINNKMPKYKAIRGIIVSQEPLIKTTTNKIKRHENLKLIKEEK